MHLENVESAKQFRLLTTIRWFFSLLFLVEITAQKWEKIYSIEKALILNFIELNAKKKPKKTAKTSAPNSNLCWCVCVCVCVGFCFHMCMRSFTVQWEKNNSISSKHCLQMRFHWDVMLFAHASALKQYSIVIAMQKHFSLQCKQREKKREKPSTACVFCDVDAIACIRCRWHPE